MMTVRLQVVIAAAILVVLAVLVNMIRRKSLELKYALPWMLVMAAVTVGSLLIGQQSSPALLTGCVAGWAAAVIAQALSAAYYGFREKQGAGE